MAQGKMLVNARSSGRACCKYCDSDYGHSNDNRAKAKLRRANRRQGKIEFKRDLNNY